MVLPETIRLVYHAHEPSPREVPLEIVYRDLEPMHPSGRPAVILNMVQTLDGAVAIAGKAWTIGSEVDHYLFRTLRGWADLVLSGAGTLRRNDVIPLTHPELQAIRQAAGRPANPTAAVVSRRADFSDEVLGRLFFVDRRFVSMVITTDQVASDDRRRMEEGGTEVVVMPAVADAEVDLAAALETLRARGVQRVLAEGGPRLNRRLVQARLVDELLVTISPRVAGDVPDADVLRGLLGGAATDLDLVSEYQYRAPDVREWYLRFRVRRA